MSGPQPDRSIEVCREYTRQRCQRGEHDCRYAHPPSHVEVINGRVTCCVDSIKGRCHRDKCRYYHPPPQIGESVLRGAPPPRSGRPGGGGRNFDDVGDMGGVNPYLATALRGYKSALDAALSAASWLAQPGGGGGGGFGGGGFGGGLGGGGGGYRDSGRPPMDRPPPPRSDGIEVCKEFLRGRCNRSENDCRFAHPPQNVNISVDNTVTACIDFTKGRCQRDPCRYFHPPEHLTSRLRFGGGGGAAGSAGRKRPYSSTSGRGDEVYSAGHNGDYGNSNGNFKRAAYDDRR